MKSNFKLFKRISFQGQMCPNEKSAQTETTSYNITKSMLYSLLVSLVLIYAGTWSDSHGKRRRPMIMIPIIGQLATDIGNVICSNIWSIPGHTVGILNGLLPGISGGRMLLFTGAVCYVTDTTGPQMRTFRIGLLAALYFIATPTGDSLSGVLAVRYGFIFVFSLCILLNSLALVNCFFFMRDTSEAYDVREVQSFRTQIVDNLRVVSKKRPNGSRMIVILALVASPLVRSPMVGEQSVLYLFVRYKFGWNEADFGFYAAFQLIGLFFGTLISLGIFSKYMGFTDSVIGTVASLSDMAAATSYIFVNAPWQMFLIPFMDIFHGAAQVICSSLLSKHVEPNEVGKISSVKGFLESVAPFVATPLYNFVYMNTLDYLPSAFYIVSVVLGLPIFVIFVTIQLVERSNRCYETKDIRENEWKSKEVYPERY
uniref:Proton-coupled folate transporter n=1 Tax=Cacopsylla melanoneura TaxID=428564 RepID=A0A8D8SD40_9HEMI